MSGDVTARLAEALAVPEMRQFLHHTVRPASVAAALVPLVRELMAEELEAAADAMFWPNSQNCGPELRARAAALRGER